MLEPQESIGLALEGGGAKGAYHMGVVKAYLESGYTFGAVVGTSIGALNGATIAQGSFEAGYRMWEQMDPSDVFDMTESEYPLLRLKEFIAGGGMNTSKIRRLVETVVDERQLRASPVDFGLVTISITDRMPLELYKQDIPNGQLIDYLMASAALPGFQPTRIDDSYYMDGGFYDNCPINMLARKGFKHVIAVRTLAPGFVRALESPDLSVTYIIPAEPLGGMLDFNREMIHRNLKMGYYDALRQIHNLKGERYYLHGSSLSEDYCRVLLNRLPEATIHSLSRMFGPPPADLPVHLLWSRHTMPTLTERMRLPLQSSAEAWIIRLAETLAEAKGVSRYALYTLEELLHKARSGYLSPKVKLNARQVEVCVAAQRILDALLGVAALHQHT